MLTEQALKGVFVPVVTPYDRRRNLDMASLQDLILRLLSKGIHGIIVNGTTGELPVIEDREFETLVLTARHTLDTAGVNPPLIVGTGSNNISVTLRRTVQAKSLGADAALVVTPNNNHLSQQGMIHHFLALAEAELPLILSDIPNCTVGAMELETIQAIMEMNHIIGLKESTGNLRHVFRLARVMSKPILCGEDELFFASLCCAAKGGILASANLDSEQFVQVYELFQAGKIDESHQAFDKLLPLIEFLFSEPNPAPLKWLLAQRGHIRSDRLRLPITAISSLTANKGAQLLQVTNS
ncbi:dihydrodipicolinate synthase family protein [Paenibacillus dokdonensis]|uniref:dihydrodipicolinate synthase family protein n=1 Tax=Paenibacillus dokdonensis TaxID=2567944 RepID=UPI0010A8002E|nr:dihydrodipicolinate synthase family protein [Paenibacillus dokdonensis]